LECPGAIQEGAVEGLYNPLDWCLVLGNHIFIEYDIIMII